MTSVYFIEDLSAGLTKIGRSDNPVRRLSELRCALRNENLHLVAVVPGNYELHLHTILGRFRVCGEWFRLTRTAVDLAFQYIVKEKSLCTSVHELLRLRPIETEGREFAKEREAGWSTQDQEAEMTARKKQLAERAEI